MDTKQNVNQEAGQKRKDRSDDEALVSGKNARRAESDLEINPDESKEDDDRRKLEEKRAYNRKNAARARQRTKEHILELTARAERYASKNEDLQKTNETLMAQVKALTEENQRLRQIVNMPRSAVSSGGSGSGQGTAISLPALGSPSATGMQGNPGGMTGGLGGSAGPSLMDPSAMHQFFPSGDVASANGANDGNAAARQRGLLLQLLQSSGQGEARQGLPPGYNF